MNRDAVNQISALGWVEGATVAGTIHDRWPDYSVELVAVDHVDPVRLAAAAEQLFDEAHVSARADADEVDAQIVRWHDAYRDFGVKPRVARVSVDALLRRARTDNGLPRITPLVDLYNAISILHCVPIGGEDLDRYDGPPKLFIASGDEEFHTTAQGEPILEHPDPGEPVWADLAGITCRRWNWRQTSRTAITADTQRVGFIIDSLAPPHDDALLAAERLDDLFADVVRRTISSPHIGTTPC